MANPQEYAAFNLSSQVRFPIEQQDMVHKALRHEQLTGYV